MADELKEVRRSCDGCSKAKKKCDGGRPCLCCQRWGVQCVYSHKLRPGPVPKNAPVTEKQRSVAIVSNAINYSSESQGGLKTRTRASTAALNTPTVNEQEITNLNNNYALPKSLLNQLGKNGFSRSEMKFLQTHLQNCNQFISLVTPAIISAGVKGILSDNPVDVPSTLAAMALTWCSCSLGASTTLATEKAMTYFNLARKCVQRCFDWNGELNARAYLAMEIAARSISIPNTGENRLYSAIGEGILSIIPPESFDENTVALVGLLRAWDSRYHIEKILERNCEVSFVDDCLASDCFGSFEIICNSTPRHRIPTYCFRILRLWMYYLSSQSCVDRKKNVSNQIGSDLTSFDAFDHATSLSQDLMFFTMLGVRNADKI